MTLDDKHKKLAALKAELEAAEREVAAHPQEALMGMAEAVLVVNKTTTKASEKISAAAETITQAPKALNRAIKDGLQAGLAELKDEQEQARKITARAKHYAAMKEQEAVRFFWLMVGVCVATGLIMVFIVWYLTGVIVDHRATIKQLEKQGAKIQIAGCVDNNVRRLCVKMDRAGKRWGENNELWMIPDGY